jgi:hypothetical protein
MRSLPALVGKSLRLGPSASAYALARRARITLDTAVLQLLRLLFGFHPWHARSPSSARPYCKQLAELVSRLGPNSVIEVGCGLGAILSRVKAERRCGYDTDAGVIRTARLFHGRSVQFINGSFEQISDTRIDVLIAVNCLHDFPPEQVECWIAPLLPVVRYLLVDAIKPGSPGGYRYYHDFGFLDGKVREMFIGEFGEPSRRFILYQVIR